MHNWLIESGEAVGAFMAALATLFGAFKAVQKYLVRPALRHFAMVHQTCLDVQEMKKELTPNGGGSMKDQVASFGKSLSRLEGLLLATLSVSENGVWLADEDGRWQWVNGWFAENVGWMPHEMHGAGWKNVVCQEDRDRVFDEWDACIRESRDFILDFAYVTKRGEGVRVQAKCAPIRSNTTRKIVGYVGFVTRL